MKHALYTCHMPTASEDGGVGGGETKGKDYTGFVPRNQTFTSLN